MEVAAYRPAQRGGSAVTPWTLEKGLGPGFTPEVKAAWTETHTRWLES